jgi:hypothetical protein
MANLTAPVSVKVDIKASGFCLDRVLTIISAHFIQDTYAAFLAPLLPSIILK